MAKRRQQIIDKPCNQCGTAPAAYYVLDTFTRGTCVPCDKAERRDAWEAANARVAHLPLRATLDRSCKRCGTSPAEYQRHAGGKDGYRATCLRCLNAQTVETRQGWDEDRTDVWRKQIRVAGSVYRQQVKREVFDHYGTSCVCCGEDTSLVLLTIDHVDGQGAKHRKELGVPSGVHFYVWLRDNHWPVGYQTLCWTCNSGRHFNGGTCPHEEQRLRLVA